jgi:hypothetical protein
MAIEADIVVDMLAGAEGFIVSVSQCSQQSLVVNVFFVVW